MVHLARFLLGTALTLLSVAASSWAIRCELNPPTFEGRLKKKLLCDQSETEIPSPVNISVWFQLKEFYMSDYDNAITAHAYVNLKWQVPSLRWNPSEHGNLSRLIVRRDHLWFPELLAINNHIATTEKPFCTTDTCRLNSDGTIYCWLPCVQSLSCGAEYAAWPFDRQSCSLIISVTDGVLNATHPTARLLLDRPATADQRSSQGRGWLLEEIRSEVRENNRLWFAVEVRRQSTMMALIFGGPAMIMILHNVLALVLVPSSRERLMLIASGMLFHAIFIQMLSYYVPANGDTVPLIYTYFVRSMFTTAILLVYTILIRSVYETRRPFPDWLRAPIGFLSLATLGGRLSDAGYFVEQQYTHFASKDVTVESQIRVDRAQLIGADWRRLAAATDRLVFALCVVWYLVLAVFYSPAML